LLAIGRDGDGFADIGRVFFLINTTAAITPNSCHGYYDRVTNTIVLYNDALSATTAPLVLGSPGTAQNSQCSVNAATSLAGGAGTDLTLLLSVTKLGAFANATHNVYFWVKDKAGNDTGWVRTATWALNPLPQVIVSTVALLTGPTQTLLTIGRDGNGFADIGLPDQHHRGHHAQQLSRLL
jgi:hypothetical protein